MHARDRCLRTDGGETEAPQRTVLVVDDEAGFAESAGQWLDQHYDIRVATSGQSAVEQYDDDVDVVLLDRRMPDLPGDEVLAKITERGDPMVAIMSAVAPDTDVLELDFDLYLQKPVTRDDVLWAAATLVGRLAYPPEIRDLLATRETLIALKESTPTHELAENERFLATRDEFERHLDAAGLTRRDLDRLAEAAAGGLD